jgi:hypothetical protein
MKCIKHWKHYLKRVKHIIMIYFDQNSLQYFNIIKQLNHQQTCWFLDFQKYDFIVIHHFRKSTQQTHHHKLTMLSCLQENWWCDSVRISSLLSLNSVNLKNQLWLTLSDNELVKSILTELINHSWKLKTTFSIIKIESTYLKSCNCLSHYTLQHLYDWSLQCHLHFKFCDLQTLLILHTQFIQDYINQCQECNWNKLIIHVTYDALASLSVSEKF